MADKFRYLVRIVNTDIKGEKQIGNGLTRIKGVGFMLANAACNVAKIDKSKKTGDLSEDEVNKLNDILRNPLKHQMPVWLLNRRKDLEDHTDKHLLSGDLEYTKDMDIKRMKMIKVYKGMRHAFGLPVRGQRTKSNFRKNKGKVQGVKRRAAAKKGK